MKACVLGAGSWGTALAIHMARLGNDVSLWAREPEIVVAVNAEHRNPIFLPGVDLPRRVAASGDPAACLSGAGLVLFVIPAQFLRSMARRLRDDLPTGVPIVLCSKGIEAGSLMTLHQVMVDELPGKYHPWLAVVSGPSFAAEVAAGMPTNVTVASRAPEVAHQVQALMGGHTFRLYSTTDVTGVEVGGSLKNVIAIAAGASDGLGFGHNTKAGLITRGLAEMTRMAVALGGDPLTLSGLSGVGDLVLTCTGHLSRNRAVGEAVARGQDVQSLLRNQVAEGVETSRSVRDLAIRHGVDMPICTEVYAVLHEGKSPRAAMETLLARELKDEVVMPRPRRER